MKNKIAERLKYLIQEKQITANKLATILEVANSVVYYWIRGNTTPNADYIIKIALYFNVTTDYLLGLENEDGSKNISINNSFNNNNGTINFKG